MKNRWTGADTPSLEGRVAIDAGAISGVGYEIAFKLAAHGAPDVVTSRDPRRTLVIIVLSWQYARIVSLAWVPDRPVF